MDEPLDAPPRPAVLGIRLLSLVYEALILAALLLVATALFTALFGETRGEPLHAALQVYLLCVTGSFYVWSWTQGRRTLPMRTWRMRLLDTAGHPLGVRRAVMRYLAALAGYSLFGLSILWALIDQEHLFLHDRLAGTRLVRDAMPRKGGA